MDSFAHPQPTPSPSSNTNRETPAHTPGILLKDTAASLPLVTTPTIIMSSQPDGLSSPTTEHEAIRAQIPQALSPHQDVDITNRAVTSLKNEHGLRVQSPLRESSVPVPSTEMPLAESVIPAKRPAPSKTKKGMATSTRKVPSAKRRKLELKRSATPSSRTSKSLNFKTGSSKGTPANSSPAPSVRSSSGDPDEDESDNDGSGGEVDDDNLYCICKKPDNGTFMIGCDGPCEDWFHGKCVGIQERNKTLIDKFICPNCEKVVEVRTTFKRMCRRHGCRQPARAAKGKNGQVASKYCSYECGLLFLRDMASRTRGQEDIAKNRSSRRKGPVEASAQDDFEARGGVLSAGEVKALLNISSTVADFHRLGEGVLSPPATPDGKDSSKQVEYNAAETAAIQQIHKQKEEARRKHQLQKDQMKFITMVKQAASSTAVEKELKAREYCGYDSRLEWTSEEFAAWRDGPAGKQAFEHDTLVVESTSSEEKDAGTADISVDDTADADQAVCDRKKCLRHLDWAKMMVDGLRAEMTENSDRMRALEQEEQGLREQATLRVKSGDDPHAVGSVEYHGLTATDTMGEDGAMDVDDPVDMAEDLAAAPLIVPFETHKPTARPPTPEAEDAKPIITTEAMAIDDPADPQMTPIEPVQQPA